MEALFSAHFQGGPIATCPGHHKGFNPALPPETWIDDVTDDENDKAEGSMQDQKVARHDAMVSSMV